MADKKTLILQNLKILRQQEYDAKQTFKANAYNKIIKQIQDHEGPIYTIDDIPEVKAGRIKEKIADIIEDGFIERTKAAMTTDLGKTNAIEAFKAVMSIGNETAKKLVEKGIYTIDDLKAKVKEDPTLLNDKQKLGLCYHDDFVKRIPRVEMEKHDALITEAIHAVNLEVVVKIAGSYRRGAVSSGDIDVLISHPRDDLSVYPAIIDALKQSGYLVDDFAYGKEKYMGIAKLPRYKTYRRIDILYIPYSQYAFALLYFTGSQDFNIEMRNVALEKGLSLSEHGFKYSSGTEKDKPYKGRVFETEVAIFDFLGIEYVEPTERAKGAIVRK